MERDKFKAFQLRKKKIKCTHRVGILVLVKLLVKKVLE